MPGRKLKWALVKLWQYARQEYGLAEDGGTSDAFSGNCGILRRSITWMGRVVRMRYEFHINLTGKVRLPVACQPRVEDKPEEDASESCGKGERAQGTPSPPLSGRRRLPWQQSQLQGTLRGASSNTRHACGAFHGSNLLQAVYGQIGRTCSCALPAINAGFGVPANLDRAQQ